MKTQMGAPYNLAANPIEAINAAQLEPTKLRAMMFGRTNRLEQESALYLTDKAGNALNPGMP